MRGTLLSVPGVVWHWPAFRTMRFCFVNDEETWERLRARVLRHANTDIQEYPTDCGLTTTFKFRNSFRCVVTLNAEHCAEPDDLLSTLVHESVHVAQYVCRSMADEEPSSEFEAYQTQDVFEKLLSDVARLRSYTGAVVQK